MSCWEVLWKKTSPCYVQLMDSSTLFLAMWKNGGDIHFKTPAMTVMSCYFSHIHNEIFTKTFAIKSFVEALVWRLFFLGMSDIFETILTRANFCTFRVGSNYPSNEIVVDPEIPSSKNPIRSCWLHPFAMVLALCERSTSFLGKRSVFFVLPKRFGESFFQKMGWIIWKGWKVFTPLFWFPRFTPHPFFCWVGWSGFWGEDFLGVGENPKESTVFFQPRHCGFPWYMSGENVWKIDNWNGNFDSLTNCVPYSAGAASNVVGF